MMTELSAIDTLSPTQLSQLLSPKNLAVWDGDDTGFILQHQLEVPLIPDLFAAPEVERLYGTTLNEKRWAAETFLGALQAVRPPKEVFQAIKEFAQYVQTLPESPLRGAPATVLYFAAIAGCFAECNVKISTLAPEQIREGCKWAATQPGAEPLRTTFEQAITVYK